jgi:hypothetical protein
MDIVQGSDRSKFARTIMGRHHPRKRVTQESLSRLVARALRLTQGGDYWVPRLRGA